MGWVHLAAWQSQRILTDPRVAALARLVVIMGVVALPTLAAGYAGESIVDYARGNIVVPLVFLAILISLAAALARPQLAVIPVWVTVIALFLLWVMSNGQNITSRLQQPGN